jgi:delta1-piperideine-2-carboxylate reductase
MRESHEASGDQNLVRLSLARLRELVEIALLRAGASPDNVAALADTIVASERDGVRSHGLLRLRGFVHSIKIGWADGQARPRIVSEAPGLLVVDAQNGFAQTALAHVRSKLVGMARSNGTAVLLTRNSHHFAALWPDIEDFAAEGFVALTCVNSKKRMAAWGGRRPVTGTNAMAFACPRTGHPPLVWDQSSSVMSQGDILLAASKGYDVHLGVGCDANGEPTTSSSAILNGGALLPFGGNKGASIAVMIEILAAALTGGPFAFEDASPAQTATTSKGGQFMLIIDPAHANVAFGERISALLAAVTAAGARRLPGDRRHEARLRNLNEGLAIDAATYASLGRLANSVAQSPEDA